MTLRKFEIGSLTYSVETCQDTWSFGSGNSNILYISPLSPAFKHAFIYYKHLLFASFLLLEKTAHCKSRDTGMADAPQKRVPISEIQAALSLSFVVEVVHPAVAVAITPNMSFGELFL